jgi:cell division protein FtsW
MIEGDIMINLFKERLHYLDKTLLIAMFILIFVGLIEIQSAGSVLDVYEDSINYMFYKQVLIVVIGVLSFFVVILFPYRHYTWVSLVGVTVSITLLIYLMLGSNSFNASKSWIDFGYFDLQPSELGKLFFIMYLGAFYNSVQKMTFDNDNFSRLLQPVMVFALFFALIAMQPDPGTALVYLLIFAGAFGVNGLKIKDNWKVFKVILVGVLLVTSMLFVVNIAKGGAVEDYFARMISRFDYQDPCTQFVETGTKGYQVCNSMIAVNNGGLFGLGYNASLQKHFYLPYAHTDSIIAIVTEEFGFVGFTIILITFAVILYKGLLYALRVPDAFGSVIATGVVVLFGSHLFINLFGNVGLLPLIGIPIPFLSYGGTFFVTSCVAMGMLQAVAIRYNKAKKTGKLD